MIESLQKEIHRYALSYLSPSFNESTKNDFVKEDLDQDLCVENHKPAYEETFNIKDEIDPYAKLFLDLVLKIKDRNFELGNCFEKSISFVSYENATLTWESCADEECKKVLTHGYSVIKHLVREIFGFETKIKHEACSKKMEEKENQTAPLSINKESDTTSYQPSSMIEDIEVGTSASCVGSCNDENSQKEIDGAKILEEPMVQKATELFEATKRTIQLKI
jgi:DNA polymerase-3 subunit gamma/tau